MRADIIKKLDTLLRKGIADEPEVVYLMAGIRKLLEQQQVKQQYRYLTFHCDWTLHTKLEGPAAQEILSKFDAVNPLLKSGLDLHQLPHGLRREIDNISQMKYFERELEDFLQANDLPAINAARYDGWIHFVHLYAKVVEDCPLVIKGKNADAAGIESVTISFESANQPLGDNMLF